MKCGGGTGMVGQDRHAVVGNGDMEGSMYSNSKEKEGCLPRVR